jgi:hypothetical protein
MAVAITKERKTLHETLKAELFKRQLSNSENFDKAILTYSSAGLALSLGFLKDFVPILCAKAAWLLYASWVLFLAAIVITILSFIASQRGIAKQMIISERYYLKMDDSALNETNFFAQCTDWLAYLAGTAFILAISFTTIFVSINLERMSVMAEERKVIIREGAPVPSIQKSPPDTVQKGAPVPKVQPVPQPTKKSS